MSDQESNDDHHGDAPKHQTVKVKVGDWEADIDVEIAPLIEHLWIAGLFTCNSCQEIRPGIAWIEFCSCEDAAYFLDIVAAEFSEEVHSLYNRVFHNWEPSDSDLQGKWEFDVHPQDSSVSWIECPHCNVLQGTQERPTESWFSISVRFPRSDISVLKQRVRGYNEDAEVDVALLEDSGEQT